LDPADGSSTKTATSGRGSVNAWLCRIGALRILVKEHGRGLVGSEYPGEWLALKAGFVHIDQMVRREAARLFALACKLHVKLLDITEESAQLQMKRAWVLELVAGEAPSKSLAQVRKLLKLPEEEDSAGSESFSPQLKQKKAARSAGAAASLRTLPPWEVPVSLKTWLRSTTGAPPDSLASLRSPAPGDEKAVAAALRLLLKAVCDCGDNEGPEALKEAVAAGVFTHVSDAILQALASPTGADRNVFLRSVELCFKAVAALAPALPSLDINMGLSKTFPVIMERTSAASASDVKIAVSSDKLVQKLAKHPKVGCETVTKMVLHAIARSECPLRALVLLRTLLGDFGLRLCAQRDIMALLLSALGTQLERLANAGAGSLSASSVAPAPRDDNAMASLRTQLVLLLSICNEFSPDTVKTCMVEIDAAQRKLISEALREAPDRGLVALGAAAAEQENMEAVGHVAGSAARALSRGRGATALEKAMPDSAGVSLRRSRPRLPQAEDLGLVSATSTSAGERGLESRAASHASAASLPLSDASTTASTDGHHTRAMPSPTASPRAGFSVTATASRTSSRWSSTGDNAAAPSSRPPAPLGLSTHLGASGSPFRFREDSQEKMCNAIDISKPLKRNSSERRLKKRADVPSMMEAPAMSR
jgi:hypothetical protein